MCGIAGFSYISGFNSGAEALSEAKKALAHRGPDDSGLYEDTSQGVGLAHTRLSIVDLSLQGHQPMYSDDGEVVLVFNGEIYNYPELRLDLESRGHIFRGHSDTEVLLRLYLDHREVENGLVSMLLKLNGIFSFGLWDSSREALLLVRDALGVKPLYYSSTGQGVAFASEVKALLPLLTDLNDGSQSVLQNLDTPAIDRYLSFLWCPGDSTPFKDVRKLGPGEAMWVKRGIIDQRIKWYRLPAFAHDRNTTASKMKRPGASLKTTDLIVDTQRHVRQAVHRQMIADVPVGAFLSGGLDSSSVVAFAREKNPDIKCFTIESTGVAEEGATDDLPYARRVAAHLKVPLEVVRVDAARMSEDFPAMVSQLDEPLADPACLNVLYISRLAREQGIKVLLSGAGGDDLFTGYRRHRALMAERYWTWLPKTTRGWLENFTEGLNQHNPLSRRIRKLFSGAALDGDFKLINYFRWVNRKDLESLYTAEFRDALGVQRAEDPMLEFLAELPYETSRLECMLALEQRFFLTDHNLTYTDKMSMAESIEVRVPFLDLDLVEFASTIPAHLKQKGKEGKWVLKKAMEPYLPMDVIYRPKSGFGAPLRRWMRVELRDVLADVLSENSLKNRGLFDSIAVQKLIRANDLGKIDASYTLLSLMCVELWCRRFVDQTTVAKHAMQ